MYPMGQGLITNVPAWDRVYLRHDKKKILSKPKMDHFQNFYLKWNITKFVTKKIGFRSTL